MVLNWVDRVLRHRLHHGRVRWWLGEAEIFTALLKACSTAPARALKSHSGLAGVMALGLMRVGERRHGGPAGAVAEQRRCAGCPGVPQAHPAQGAMTMNISANLLGWTTPPPRWA